MTLPASRPKAVLLVLLAMFMLLMGTLHFVKAPAFVDMMPSALARWALPLVLISGFFELAGGVGLLIPALRRPAAWGLVALYIAVFPANLNMAINHVAVQGVTFPSWTLWARLPFQLVFIGLAAWFAQPDAARKRDAIRR